MSFIDSMFGGPDTDRARGQLEQSARESSETLKEYFGQGTDAYEKFLQEAYDFTDEGAKEALAEIDTAEFESLGQYKGLNMDFVPLSDEYRASQRERLNRDIEGILSARGQYNSGRGIRMQQEALTDLAFQQEEQDWQRRMEVNQQNQNLANQRAKINWQGGLNRANQYNQLNNNQANLASKAGGDYYNMYSGLGSNLAGIELGKGAGQANLDMTNKKGALSMINDTVDTVGNVFGTIKGIGAV